MTDFTGQEKALFSQRNALNGNVQALQTLINSNQTVAQALRNVGVSPAPLLQQIVILQSQLASAQLQRNVVQAQIRGLLQRLFRSIRVPVAQNQSLPLELLSTDQLRELATFLRDEEIPRLQADLGRLFSASDPRSPALQAARTAFADALNYQFAFTSRLRDRGIAFRE